MAESVVKLKLESGEYDSKIKRAAQNILSFGENCQKAGQSVAKADKDTLEYVQSIGKMETVAKNTKGKINELTTAFTDLSVQYKNLTDEEKNSPFGQALSQSIDQLKTRINESKAQLSEVNQSLQGTSNQSEQTGGVMQQLANKFTLNVWTRRVVVDEIIGRTGIGIQCLHAIKHHLAVKHQKRIDISAGLIVWRGLSACQLSSTNHAHYVI